MYPFKQASRVIVGFMVLMALAVLGVLIPLVVAFAAEK